MLHRGRSGPQRTCAFCTGSQTVRGEELLQPEEQDSAGGMPASKAQRLSGAARRGDLSHTP